MGDSKAVSQKSIFTLPVTSMCIRICNAMQLYCKELSLVDINTF